MCSQTTSFFVVSIETGEFINLISEGRKIIYLCSLFSLTTLSSVSVVSLVSPSSNSLSVASMVTGEGILSLLGTDCIETWESIFLMSKGGDFVLLDFLDGDL